MQSAISGLLNLIAARLSAVSPFAKAIVPSAAGLVGSLVNMAFAGSFNTTSIVVLVVGVVAAAVTYLVPNKPKAFVPPVVPTPAPAPAPKAAAKPRLVK